MIADNITHYILDMVILTLAVVRYLWGPLTDLTRLGVVFCFMVLVINDIEYHYDILSPIFSPGPPVFRISAKLLLALFLIADLIRDYLLQRYRETTSNWAKRAARRVR